jgi:hypothetical protein
VAKGANMHDLIDRKALLEKVETLRDIYNENVETVNVWSIEDAPAVNVIPVMYGEWVKDIDDIYICSNCGGTCPYNATSNIIECWACNYCPNCGAKMNDKKIKGENK